MQNVLYFPKRFGNLIKRPLKRYLIIICQYLFGINFTGKTGNFISSYSCFRTVLAFCIDNLKKSSEIKRTQSQVLIHFLIDVFISGR